MDHSGTKFAASASSIVRQGPQLCPIKALHRHNGYISFMVKAEDDGEENGRMKRFAIRADVLDQCFPEFTADLVRNSFVSINASYTLSNHSKTVVRKPKPIA